MNAKPVMCRPSFGENKRARCVMFRAVTVAGPAVPLGQHMADRRPKRRFAVSRASGCPWRRGAYMPSSGKTQDAQMLSITLNGEPRRVAPGSIAALVEALGLPLAKVAVERNLEIVPRSTLGEVELAEGDRLEIVHFVGGG